MTIENNNYFGSEIKSSMPYYLDWAARSFEEGDWLVTVGLPTIRTPKHYIHKTLDILDRQVYGRKPIHLIRFPVLVYKPQYTHLHMLIKDVEFKSNRFPNFRTLLKTQFEKNVLTYGGVDIQRIDSNIHSVCAYALYKQGHDFDLLINATHLPPYEVPKQIH